ncbi:microtubule nucleation factor SSNA1-like [Corythoichthys intestinalis]|uniref:microtubule nucleation factor SSNA1-like n=1 Tax=Corythoichthys intestinalis TaxID=161448 RepID=UPI0025A6618C|nr:microtubule nucleation factor SSNA1-like [Corythoichthys intestinalis]XP_061800161.1 microtubule nucleation factor SSNA1-like [Nerophis lumbriciformis]
MSQQAAALQTYNNELVKCFDDLFSKRERLRNQIKQEEEIKEQLHCDIHNLSEKLNKVNKSLAQKTAAYDTIERTISETQSAYTKILESSQSLLSVMKQAGNQ